MDRFNPELDEEVAIKFMGDSKPTIVVSPNEAAKWLVYGRPIGNNHWTCVPNTLENTVNWFAPPYSSLPQANKLVRDRIAQRGLRLEINNTDGDFEVQLDGNGATGYAVRSSENEAVCRAAVAYAENHDRKMR